MIQLSRRFWTRFVAIAAPYWRSEERGMAWTLLALLVLLMVGQVGFEVLFNQRTGELTSALSKSDASRFWRTIIACVAILVVLVPLNAFYWYVCDKLRIHWRRWLTKRILNRYFDNRAYYEVQSDTSIDNPDQRIAEDINTFTQNAMIFLPLILWAPIQIAGFSSALWHISPTLVYFLILYAVIGTTVTTLLFGRGLIGLNAIQLKREANFRFSLVRIRENAESIALYRGETQEQTQVEQNFDAVFKTSSKLVNRQLLLSLFVYSYKYLTYVVPFTIIASQVLSGRLEVGRAAEAAGAFTAILMAVAIVVDKFDALSRFAAGIERLDSFVNFLEVETPKRQARRQIQVVRGKHLVIDRLSLRTIDDQRWIVKELSANVRPNEGLVIMGPSGSGKSSLLRAIAGLASSGHGTIVRPGLNQMLFLPQRPYMVLGTLRDQLLYPFTERYQFDGELLQILEQVNLPRLVEQFGGLDAEADWENVLSIGEQQRLAFARILIAKPRYAMLDEATSALDVRNEQRLYELLRGTPTTFVSVSHHDSIQHYHQNVLELYGDGTWQLQPTREYSAAG